MADWSVEEQVVPIEDLVGTITTIHFRVDPGRSHIMIMELHTDGVGGGQLLTFNRNGLLLAVVTLQPPPQNGPEEAEAKAEEDDAEDDGEPAKRSAAHRSAGRRR